MQWISTTSQKLDERLYRVCVWVKKYHEDAINRVVLTVDLSKARHDPIGGPVRAELLWALFSDAEREQRKIGASGSEL
ncbi:hypothetical protein [Escherichia coli]|uniref:hypothetical protein n=1 Tax=Escherichia coli TaxID=562 RepID=UPI0020239356|nr:hypothetical protein [Escherichia coli]